MYTAVLATLLTAGSPTAAWHQNTAPCYGSYGCYAPVACVAANRAPSGCHCNARPFGGGHHHGGHQQGGHQANYCASYCSSCVCATCYCHCSTCHAPCHQCSTCHTCVVAAPAAPQVVVVQSPPQVVVVPSAPPQTVQAIPARVTVTLPSDARMWIDNVESPLTSGVRSFITPPLHPGQNYGYTIRIEMMRNGHVVSQSQRVPLFAGENARVDFNGPAR